MHTQIGETTGRRPQKIIEVPSLYTLARDALRETGNDADAAEENLVERFASDQALLRAIVRGAVRQAVCSTVTNVLGAQRPARAKSGAKALAFGLKSALLDMPLADGSRLRDATVVEISKTAERWEKVSTTMAHRARWLRAIAAALPPGRRCGDVFTEKKAAQLFRNAA